MQPNQSHHCNTETVDTDSSHLYRMNVSVLIRPQMLLVGDSGVGE